LGSFSNWGQKTVHIAAPGVNIFSTMVRNRYSNIVATLGGQAIHWDGTSMATPHVSGAVALYWSAHPEKSWQDVRAALLSSAKQTDGLANKVSSGGQLDVAGLMQTK
jgi:thermitase